MKISRPNVASWTRRRKIAVAGTLCAVFTAGGAIAVASTSDTPSTTTARDQRAEKSAAPSKFPDAKPSPSDSPTTDPTEPTGPGVESPDAPAPGVASPARGNPGSPTTPSAPVAPGAPKPAPPPPPAPAPPPPPPPPPGDGRVPTNSVVMTGCNSMNGGSGTQVTFSINGGRGASTPTTVTVTAGGMTDRFTVPPRIGSSGSNFPGVPFTGSCSVHWG